MFFNTHLRAVAMIAVACSSLASMQARSGIITTTRDLPPFGTYAGGGHFAEFVIAGAPFPVRIIGAAHTPAPETTHREVICPIPPLPCIMDRDTPGFMEEHTFDSHATIAFFVPGSTIEMTFMGVMVKTRVTLLSYDGVEWKYSNELVEMTVPEFDFLGIGSLLREDQDAGKESTGETTITSLGGGLFRVDSFFDVFTELSVDGGLHWIDSSDPPGHVALVPEPGTLALAGAALALLGWLSHRAGLAQPGLGKQDVDKFDIRAAADKDCA